jgi:hypothetical protein
MQMRHSLLHTLTLSFITQPDEIVNNDTLSCPQLPSRVVGPKVLSKLPLDLSTLKYLPLSLRESLLLLLLEEFLTLLLVVVVLVLLGREETATAAGVDFLPPLPFAGGSGAVSLYNFLMTKSLFPETGMSNPYSMSFFRSSISDMDSNEAIFDERVV